MYLLLRSLEEFGDDNCSKEIIQLRYNHYLERVQCNAYTMQQFRLCFVNIITLIVVLHRRCKGSAREKNVTDQTS